ncbi:MAG: hypothetical protein ABF966_09635 [Bifidobacterium psychraerophilum]|uniref:hypothetical protein n=1 Tax=Bifidobacterium psychraerophilum TaxID=218140 RepID=UPI0039EC55B1
MPDFDDYDDVTTRPTVWAEQHGNTDQERNQRTRTLLEKRKDAILDALTDPNLSRGERKLLEAQHKEVKANTRVIECSSPVHALQVLDGKW